MKKPTTIASTLLLAFSVASVAAQENSKPTPAERKVAAAQRVVAANPDKAEAYPPLAFAYAARARETADGNYYTKAMAAAEKSLQLDPENFSAQKAEAWVMLGQHEFQKALVKARALSKRSGDDPMVWAMLTDAAIETGNYAEAEEAAQWALDMDPGGAPGLTRAAYLREHFGDFDGAIELMQRAFNRTRPGDTEDRAWLLTHLGHLYLLKNQVEQAAQSQLAALELFPDYHYALLNLAHVRAAQGDHDAALELHRKHYATAPHPENLYELAVALGRAGRDEEAGRAFEKFEIAALGESDNVDNANRELVAFYVNEAKKPAEALRVAKLEMANRTDFRTRHAYAWALHSCGEFAKAHAEMNKALQVGVKYPVMQFHAGIIARDAGDELAAKKFLQASLDQAPKSAVSAAASQALESL